MLTIIQSQPPPSNPMKPSQCRKPIHKEYPYHQTQPTSKTSHRPPQDQPRGPNTSQNHQYSANLSQNSISKFRNHQNNGLGGQFQPNPAQEGQFPRISRPTRPYFTPTPSFPPRSPKMAILAKKWTGFLHPFFHFRRTPLPGGPEKFGNFPHFSGFFGILRIFHSSPTTNRLQPAYKRSGEVSCL